MIIRNYTLNFIRLGKPLNNQYPIYLRYFYTLNQKKYTYNYNCETLLSIEQLQQLKEEKLSHTIQLPLLHKKKKLEELITALYIKHNQFPDSTILKDYVTVRTKEFTLQSHIDDFLNTLKYKAKKVSIRKYREGLKHLEKYFNLNQKHFKSFDDLVTERTIKNLEKYLDALAIERAISNNSFKNYIEITIRFLNFLAKKYSITPIEYKVKIPLLSEKIHITESEFHKLVDYDITTVRLRNDCKINIKQAQDIAYINSFIGLRINELLLVKKANVEFNTDHIVIKFYEQKKNDIRQILIVDQKGIELLEQYSSQSQSDYLFNISSTVFNNNLKRLAKLVGMTEPVEFKKNYRTETITITKPKWKLITSHALRRYAVNQNVVKYGIDIARQFSGHKDYATIKKNYMRNINQQELLERLKDAK